MSADNPWEDGTTADSAWANLSKQQTKGTEPGFVAGATAQLKKEVHVPTSAELGATLVHTIATALQTGEEEWNKIIPTANESTKSENAPSIPGPVKEVVKLLGLLAINVAKNATEKVVSTVANRKKNSQKSGSTAIVPLSKLQVDGQIVPSTNHNQNNSILIYKKTTHDEDVIDAETTEIK